MSKELRNRRSKNNKQHFSIHHYSASWFPWDSKLIMKLRQKSYCTNNYILKYLLKGLYIPLQFKVKFREEGLFGVYDTLKRKIIISYKKRKSI